MQQTVSYVKTIMAAPVSDQFRAGSMLVLISKSQQLCALSRSIMHHHVLPAVKGHTAAALPIIATVVHVSFAFLHGL